MRLLAAFLLASSLSFAIDAFAQPNNEDAFSQPIEWCDAEPLISIARKNKRKRFEEFFANKPNFDVNCIGEGGNTALIIAASQRSYKIIPLLLERGADPRIKNNFGQTAYQLAAMHTFSKKTNPREKLLAAGADPNAADYAGHTAAHMAALRHRSSGLWELNRQGVDMTSLTKDGSSIYDVAAYAGRVQGLQRAINLGQANLNFYNVMNTIEGYGVRSRAPYNGYKPTKSDGQLDPAFAPKPQKPKTGLAKLVDGLVDKSQGTGRKCNHIAIIGNFSGMPLYGGFSTKLSSGRYQEYGEKSGGKFQIPAGGISKRQIWLTQGGSQRLYLSAGGSSSRAGYIDFDVSAACPHGERSLSKRSFVVEKDNRNGSLSIFEDANGDGRRDDDAQSTSPVRVRSENDNACAALIPLATQLKPDSTGLLYDDTQLNAILSTSSCSMSAAIAAQRTQLKSLLLDD